VCVLSEKYACISSGRIVFAQLCVWHQSQVRLEKNGIQYTKMNSICSIRSEWRQKSWKDARYKISPEKLTQLAGNFDNEQNQYRLKRQNHKIFSKGSKSMRCKVNPKFSNFSKVWLVTQQIELYKKQGILR